MTAQHWLDPTQQHAARSALRVLRSWASAADDPDEVLLRSLAQEDLATVLLGLATVSRLLAIELGACSARSEHEVLAELDAVVAAAGSGHAPQQQQYDRLGRQAG